jgi:hypothetical protein
MIFLKDYRYPVIYIQLPVGTCTVYCFFFDLCLHDLKSDWFVVFQVNIF